MLPDAAATNRAYYDSEAPGRDDYWRLMAAPRLRVRRIGEIVRAASPRSLVDLGCGGGVLLSEISQFLPEASLAGIDLSERQIEVNRQSLLFASWFAGDLTKAEAVPPQLHGSFDVVTCSEVIEHVDSPQSFLRNARLLTGAGGLLVLTTQSGPVHETERRVGHVRHFTGQELSALLEENGWQVERVWNEGFPFHDLSKWYANLRPDATVARFGERAYGPSERAVCAVLRLLFRFNSRRRGMQLFATARAR